MITDSKVTEIFCIADDFCKEFEAEMVKNAHPSWTDTPRRHRSFHNFLMNLLAAMAQFL